MGDIEHVLNVNAERVDRDADTKKLKDRANDKTEYSIDEIEDAVRAWARGL